MGIRHPRPRLGTLRRAAGLLVAGLCARALSGCKTCSPSSGAADSGSPSTEAGQASAAFACTTRSPAIVLDVRDAELGTVLRSADALTVPFLGKSSDGGRLVGVLDVALGKATVRALSAPLSLSDELSDWVMGAKLPTLAGSEFEAGKRFVRLWPLDGHDAGVREPWPRDSLSFVFVETANTLLLVRTLPNSVDIVDVHAGKVVTSVKSARPEQVVARVLGERVFLVWTAGMLVDLDAGDYAEGPGELRTERWLESTSVDRSGKEPTPVARIMPREKHIEHFSVLEDGTVIGVQAEQATEGEGAAVVRSHVRTPEKRERLAMGAYGAVDAFQSQSALNLVYWTAEHEAQFIREGADAGPSRLPKLDASRVLGVVADSNDAVWIAAHFTGRETRIEFLSCK
jgi:hypothetical protein